MSVQSGLDDQQLPDHPDAELLRQCAAFREQHLAYVALRFAHDKASDAAINAALDAWFERLEPIRWTPAKTLLGLKAKAAAYGLTSCILTGDVEQELETLTELDCIRNLIVDVLQLQG